MSNRALKTEEQIDFWEYANGEDWGSVVNADNKLLHDFADQGGNLFSGRLQTINCSALFTGSLKDSFIPDIREQNPSMAKQIRNSTTFLCNDGDHPFMWNCPDLFRSVSSEFLKRLA